MPTAKAATRQPGAASGMSSWGKPSTSIEYQMMRADPIRRLSRPANTPPATPPRLATAMSSPVSAGLTRRTRIRKTISSATPMLPNRFAVPVHAAILRRTGCRSTNESPSAISALSPARPPSPAGGSSRSRMSSRDATEMAYEIASAPMARAAPTRPTSPPPRPGPATCAKDWVAPSLPLPSTRCSLVTTTGR